MEDIATEDGGKLIHLTASHTLLIPASDSDANLSIRMQHKVNVHFLNPAVRILHDSPLFQFLESAEKTLTDLALLKNLFMILYSSEVDICAK